ncbi:3-hydroxyacyl-CoA dehydrogenase NAD-binding domain-containing protein [Streptomyces odontomachi]|uniref:3-hydroxyacyl-CoA dehydrogenase NAD-binding domain-containing protein n=1 Tax=Streptomyces odontomachi TaxID=2944940 RepID=UPI00210EC225|nr:3-hydroxyacyl-CoA dehydrogenase NAD-binding domain-containing protein [Streptomyces sp. ODS25]
MKTVVLSETVRYGTQDGVAVILLDNPPVNALGHSVRVGVAAALDRVAEDTGVHAAVIAGSGRGFCGGADVRQFNTPAATAGPMLGEVIAKIEASAKPVVAAIHGVALGGGLELALGCHHRIATADARLGLTEVTLGLVPGAGGTQRLPRLVGVAEALDLVQHGRRVTGVRAAGLGLVDAVFEGDPIAAGTAHAAAAEAVPAPGVRSMAPTEFDFSARRDAVGAKDRNALAQRAAVDCLEAATRLPLEEGLTYERARFDELVAGPESKALRHVFFAERQAAKIADLPADTAVREVVQAAVIGAGTMGGGIAMAFANAGIPVVLFERDQQALDRGLARMRHNYDITAAKGRLTAAQVEERMGLIRRTLDLADAADADLVIEAVFEDMDVKKDVFRRLDAVCKPGAILASNTSRLSVDEIAAVTSRPQDVIGLHFFSPANIMRLLEVVRGDATSPTTLASCTRAAQRIGKAPVVVRVCEGFVGNRMLTPYWREANFLLEEGASPQQVDQALTRFGMAMGPHNVADLAGLDINWATRKRLAPTRPAHLRYCRVPDRICEQGRFGQKTGAGYYRYEEGSRIPHPDPVVDEIIARCAREAGVERRALTDDEIVERCILALVNEGAQILAEGIAQRASDIDVVYVSGYGFPAWRGGPMHYAETLGLDVTLERIRALHEVHGEHWTPAPLLQRLVAAGATRFETC